MDVKANYLEQMLGENQEALFAIREVPHFRTCSENLLRLIYTYGRIYALREGEKLTREGEYDQWVFFILNGKLAVYVGEEWVDTISSSLVGERCILGEPRKATLSAGEGGVTALGVDMAVLDALEGSGGQTPEMVPLYAELLSIITAEIINRIADLAYNQLEISSKLAINVKSEAITDVINGFMHNAYAGRPEANLAIYKQLARRNRELLALVLEDDKITVDTRRLYALCVNGGHGDLILELAGEMHDFLLGTRQAEQEEAAHYTADYNFFEFVGHVFASIAQQYDGIKSGKTRGREFKETAWREKFRLGGDLTIDLDQLRKWLKDAYQFTDLEIIEALKFMLHEASAYTAHINMANRKMIHELSQIKLLQKLDTEAAVSDNFTPEYYSAKTPEEMIPMFSKQILEVHLVKPYLEKLGLNGDAAAEDSAAPAAVSSAEEGEAAAPPASSSAESSAAADAATAATSEEVSAQDVADSLFD